jgi:hypothetical protein
MPKKKQTKQIEAEERQKLYDNMPLSERVALAHSRRGKSEKEITKLNLRRNSNGL